MPQITVDYSAPLAEGFDRRGFALALHDAAVEIAAARTEACKTQFRATDDTVVGHDVDGHGVVHVTIGLLAGRSEQTKSELVAAALELLRKHLTPAEGTALHASAEVRDLAPSYAKHES
ncbi:isomerase [Streptomyces sp. NPDC005423]|uniref:5-carboxymethyl-2-hydroxymuconate Delta-isomerase n=1 Tax=Streptomyces sp. NPDC005423 TaxID=3155343 RepID=UPI0033B6AFB0